MPYSLSYRLYVSGPDVTSSKLLPQLSAWRGGGGDTIMLLATALPLNLPLRRKIWSYRDGLVVHLLIL